MIELTSSDAVEINGHGLLWVVDEPNLDYPERLVGQDVLLDGVVRRVKGVESLVITRPYPRGLRIGVIVEALQPADTEGRPS